MAEQDKKISELPALETVSGDELLVVAKGGGNGSVTTGQIVAKARQGLVAQVPGKGLSTNDFTDVLKAKLDSLKNYDDEALRAAVDALEGQLDTILGDGASAAIDTFNEIEAFLTGITDTQTLTGLLAELKSTITGETDTKLEGKVDKAVWDGEHAQFNIVGYYNVNTGRTGTADTWRRTPLMVLNRNAPIVFRNLVLNSDAGIVFFDADRRFISGMGADSGVTASQQIAVADFPEDAVYVGLCTFVNSMGDNHNASYSNGETVESREGATAERIVADREKENAQFGLSGYWTADNKGIASSTGYAHSGYLPINREYDIKVAGQGTVKVAAIALFDAQRKIIVSKAYPAQAVSTVVVGKDEIPAHAVYFMASTRADNIKAIGAYWSNGPTREAREAREGAVSDAIGGSKLALFVDMWTRCFDCQYDAGKEKPFMCNGVELTYAEAIAVYNAPRLTYNNSAGLTNLIGGVKTVILGSASTRYVSANMYAEFCTTAFIKLRICIDNSLVYTSNIKQAFYGCAYLSEILGGIRALISSEEFAREAFYGCSSLENVKLHSLAVSISFADSPLLSLASLEYLVANAANTGPITVTVHPDVYAKLTNTDGLEDYLPANMVKTQRAARSITPNCNYADGVWTIQRQDRDTYLSLYSNAVTAGRPYAISMNVDGMAEGEEWHFYLNGGITSGSYFKMKQGACSGVLYPKSSSADYIIIDDVNRNYVDMSLTTPITVTDIMVVPGEAVAPKWAPHPDEIEDAELRERVKWANLVYVAAAKQITFASV